MKPCLIALGANIGNPAQQLTAALRSLEAEPQVNITAVSRWRWSVAVGGPEGQPPYCNGVVRAMTPLTAAQLFDRLRRIEDQLGRVRTVTWGPRTIDLDLLLVGDQQLITDSLTVPHPRMLVRRFVLYPAAEVAPDQAHPATGWSLTRHAHHLRYSLPYVSLHGLDVMHRRQLVDRLAQMMPLTCLPELAGCPEDGAAGGSARCSLEFAQQAGEVLSSLSWRQLSRPVVSPWWLPLDRLETMQVPRPKWLVHLHPPEEWPRRVTPGCEAVPTLHVRWESLDQAAREVSAAMCELLPETSSCAPP